MRAGEPHAEVNAINSVSDQSLLKEAVLYVNLEPCSHTGKTPPCADLIIKKKIKKVVVGMRDPHSKVAGRGISKLRKAKIEVTEGILDEECKKLNAAFVTFHTEKRPHVVLKWAQSPDGFIDRYRSAANPKATAVTGKYTQLFTHKLRSRFDAIMVGTKTAEMDNPTLNARFWDGNDPLRAVLDEHLILSKNLNLKTDERKTLILNSSLNKKDGAVEYIKIPFDKNLINNTLKALKERDIVSLFVEGGSTMLSGFIDNELWDEAYRFTSSTPLHEGIRAPEFTGHFVSRHTFGSDLIEYFTRL